MYIVGGKTFANWSELLRLKPSEFTPQELSRVTISNPVFYASAFYAWSWFDLMSIGEWPEGTWVNPGCRRAKEQKRLEGDWIILCHKVEKWKFDHDAYRLILGYCPVHAPNHAVMNVRGCKQWASDPRLPGWWSNA